jgi:hypothetical protein
LVVSQSPTSIGSGEAFATTGPNVLTVHVTDSFGNLVITSSAAVSVSTSVGTLSGTTTVSTSGGIARFSDFTLNGTATNSVTLTFSSSPDPLLLDEATTLINLTAGPAAKLSVDVFDSTVPSGQILTVDPVVRIQDSGGNTVTSATNQVTATISAGATLQLSDPTATRSVTVTADQGEATFNDLKVNAKIASYTITFSATNLTPASRNIAVAAGAASKLVISPSLQNSNVQSDVPFGSSNKVQLVDAAGNIVSGTSYTVKASVQLKSGSFDLIEHACGATATQLSDQTIVSFTNHTPCNWSVPKNVTNLKVLAVGGGGGGGSDSGSGGGGGALIEGNLNTSADFGSTINITVGSGGVGGSWSNETLSKGGYSSSVILNTLNSGQIEISANGGKGGSANNSSSTNTNDGANDGSGGTTPSDPINTSTYVNLTEVQKKSGGNGGAAREGGYSNQGAGTNGTGGGTSRFFTGVYGGGGGSGSSGDHPAGLGVNGGGDGSAFDKTWATAGAEGTGGGGGGGSAYGNGSVKPNSRDGAEGGLGTVKIAYETNQALSASITSIAEKQSSTGIFDFSDMKISGISEAQYSITYEIVSGDSVLFTTGSESQTVTLDPGIPIKLSLSTPATDTASNSLVAQAPQVSVLDSNNNTVIGASDLTVVTATIGTGAQLSLDGNTWGQSVSVNTSSGVATFTGLRIRGIANTYTINYTSGSLTFTDQTITLSAGDPSQIQVTDAAGFSSGAAATTQPVITVKDASGNTVTDYVGSVTADFTAPKANASLIGIQTRPFINGVATFSGLGIRGPIASDYSITFTPNTAITAATQSSISLAPGIATQLSAPDFSGSALSGAAFGAQPTITFLDSAGNTTSASATITATVSAGATIVGTNTVSVTTQTSATFNNLGLNGINEASYTVTYSAAGLSSTSQQVTVTTGAATAIAFDTRALGTISGANFSTQPKIKLIDSGGNTVINTVKTITASITGINGTLTGIRTAATIDEATGEATGVAIFSGLGFTGAAGTNYTLSFSADGISTPITQNFTATAGVASKLVIHQLPANVKSGEVFGTNPKIHVTDSFGNLVTSSSALISVTSSNGTLTGTTTVNAAGGVAEFTNLTLSGIVSAGISYTLTFTSTGLGNVFEVVELQPGVSAQLVLEQQAGSISGETFSWTIPSGQAMTTGTFIAPQIFIKDSGGNIVTNAINEVTARISGGATLQLATGDAATQVAIPAVAGDATFTGMRVNAQIGTYTITYSVSNLPAVSQSITVTTGLASQLELVTAGVASSSGREFNTAATIALRDSGGNPVVQDGVAITASISNGGTLANNFVNTGADGLATFSTMTMSGTVGVEYTITFSSGSLKIVTQTAYVGVGPASQLAVTRSSVGTASGSVFTTQPQVSLQDAGGNLVSNHDENLYVEVLADSPVVVIGDISLHRVPLVNGIATFTGIGISGTAGTSSLSYRLVEQGDPTVSAANQAITISVGIPTNLTITSASTTAPSGEAFGTPRVVTVRDSGGNLVTTNSSQITASVVGANGALVGTSVVSASSGVATYSSLGVSGITGTSVTIRYTALGIGSVDEIILVSAGSAAKLAFAPGAETRGAAPSGGAFTNQPVIRAYDSGGNFVETATGIVTAVITQINGAGDLVGSTTATMTNGVATFSDLGISGTSGRSYTITYSFNATGSTPSLTAFAESVPVSVGAPASLVLNSQSVGSASGAAFTTQPSVTLIDSGGNTVTDSAEYRVKATVTAINQGLRFFVKNFSSATAVKTANTAEVSQLTTGTCFAGVVSKVDFNWGSGNPGGNCNNNNFSGYFVGQIQAPAESITLKVSADDGIIVSVNNTTVINNWVDQGPSLYNATGTISGLTAGEWYPIEIRYYENAGGAAVRLFWEYTGQATQIVPDERFRVGEPTAVSDAVLVGTDIQNAVTGVASFTNLGISGTTGLSYLITYSLLNRENATLSTTTTSQVIPVTTGAPTNIVFNDASLGTGRAAISAQAFAVQPVIEIRDSGNNVVTSSSALVTATLTTTAPVAPLDETTLGASLGGTTQVNAVDGVVRFTDLSVTGLIKENDLNPYNYTLTYTYSVDGLTTTLTEIVTLSPGTPSSIALGTSASGAASGAAFSSQPKINILDSAGNIVTTSLARVTATLSKAGSLGTGEELVGTTFADAAAGVALFINLGISGLIDTDYTITYAVAGLPSITQTLKVNVGAPTQLRFKTESVGSAAGAAFTTQPEIEIRDSGGNLTTSTLPVTATITQINLDGVATGQLIGTQTLNAISGVVAFTNLGITGIAGQTYTITYSSGDLQTVIQTVSVTPGQATQVGIVVGASGAVAGQVFVRQPQIAIQDAAGNTVTDSSETVRVAISEGGTLIGTTARAATNGIAEFTNIGIRGNSGVSYTLSYSIGSFAPTTESINLVAGPAAQLTFAQNAVGANSGAAFSTQPRILIKDEFGNTVLTSSAQVTATITQVGGFGALLGTTSVNAVNGVATFTNLGITGTNNTAYRVTYTAANIGTISENIVVNTGVGTTLELTQAAVGNTVGANFSVQPRLTIKDNAGNVVENLNQNVTASVSGSGELLGTTSVTTANGIAEFSDLALVGTAGDSYTITFTAGDLTRTQVITLTTGAPYALELTRAAVGTTVDSIFSTQPLLTIKDRGGNTVSTSATITVTVSQDGQLTGNTSRNSVNGTAEFFNLGISGTVGETYTLSYATGGITPVTQTLTLTAAQEALVPLFSVPTSISNGFRVSILNFDAANYSWIATSNSGNSTINNATGVITVSGLAPGASANVEVSASRNGYATGRAQLQAAAQLGAALNPTFANITPTADGFTAQMSNFSAAYSYVAAVAGGTATVSASGLVRVTGINPETNSVVTVTTQRSGYAPGTGSTSATSLKAGSTPTFSTPTILNNGYTVQITNYDSSFTYASTVTSGGTVSIGADGLVTVSQLADGVSATTLVTTSKVGHAIASSAITSNSTNPGLVPEFGIPVATATGFLVPVTNYNALHTWTVTNNSSGAISEIITVGANTNVRINNLPEGEPVVVTVSSARENYFNASSTITLTLRQGLTPTFGAITPTNNGFTVQVTNYYSEAERNDLAYNWAISASSGSASINSSGLITVTGLGIGTTAELTVTTSRAGYTTLSSSLTGASFNADGVTTPLPAGLVTTFGPAVSTSDGFNVTMSNYNSAFSYEVTVNQNGQVVRDGNLITVTGIEPGTPSIIVVTTNRNGYLTGSASLTATSITGAGIAPTFGTVTQLVNGYRVEIANYNPNFSYEGTATNNGSVSVGSDGFVTVSEVAGGIESVLSLTVTREGYTNASATFSAFSLDAPALVPIFDTPISNETGFSVAILNYDASFTYTLSATNGATATRTDGVITVSGLTRGDSSTLTVATSRVRSGNASATLLGSTLAVGGTSPALNLGFET